MTNPATTSLLDRANLDRDSVRHEVARGLSGADDGELFLEYSQTEALMFDNGRLKQATYDTSQGFGLRAVKDDAVGYAHSSDVSLPALIRAADAVAAVRGGYSGSFAAPPAHTNVRLYGDENPLEAPGFESKVKLLAEIDAYVRDKDPRVRQVTVSLGATWQVVEILRPDGESYRDIRPLVRVNISVVAGQGDHQESGSKGYGGREGYARFIETKAWREAADGAIREAMVNLESVPAPAGEMDVVLGAGWPGVMLHEAVGHGLEGDLNRKQTSAFAGLMGQQVAATDGTLAADVRPLVRLNVSVIVEDNGRREQSSTGGGGRGAYADFFGGDAAEQYAKEAVRQAITLLSAVAAPAGSMPVVLGPGWPGVMLHEAVGHGLEGDFNRKGTSAYSGRIGQKVASPLCTVVDDGTLPNRRGSLTLDDEGTPTQCTTLIENGILKGYIQDKLNARLMGMQPTGNGRRESFAHLPMPRMTNTYLLAGPHDPEEIIRSVKKGLYAVNFAGGQVDITNGNYVFSASEAYLIEDGKVTRPVKGATLTGNGPESLSRVSMLGTDMQLDSGIGVCGKDGQSVPVGVGQPTLKIDAMTVGGTHV